jgi:hypothetical protein
MNLFQVYIDLNVSQSNVHTYVHTYVPIYTFRSSRLPSSEREIDLRTGLKICGNLLLKSNGNADP